MPHDSHSRERGLREASPSLPSLSESYPGEFGRIRRDFEKTGDGRTATRAQSALVDRLLERLYRDCLSPDLTAPESFSMVALGGYGREELFPYSDIDLLFLSADARDTVADPDALATITRTLWDLGLRVGSSSRTLAECGRFHPDNLELNIALLDCRYLFGDRELFRRLREEEVPHLVARDRQDLVRDLAEVTRRRHAKYGNTIFHLEPNLKEAPGGLRDYHVARWLTLILQLETQSRWVEPEHAWPPAVRDQGVRAFEYLGGARCFLHYRRRRDDNLLTYELQDEAAQCGIGHVAGQAVEASDWMRRYFQHARAVHRLVSQALDDGLPQRSSLYGAVRDLKSRLANADFSVVRGRVFPRQPEAVRDDPGLLLRLFEFAARHGLRLSRETERWVEESSTSLATRLPSLPSLWSEFRRILLLPRAAEALRAMHRLGVLVALFPEFAAVDSLVIRDYYHRYTVDEHSFLTLQTIQALGRAKSAESSDSPRPARAGEDEPMDVWEKKLAELLAQIEQRELLLLSLLFHDVGKGMPVSDHTTGSLEAFQTILARLRLESEAAETVRFLVANHLEMSATLQRRDIFDPETVRAFAGLVGSVERLQMLCLFTYADIRSVNPEALTPWKAELLWRLHVAAANYLTRSLDEERVHVPTAGLDLAQRIASRVRPAPDLARLTAFLEGFPKRYLSTHSPEEVAAHFGLASRLEREPVQIDLHFRNRLHELTVLTADRPLLFAHLTGTLAAWGMNIVKADAFANSAGVVLDTFRFVDLYRTLELNPPEVERFKETLVAVLRGEADLEELMDRRLTFRKAPQPKVRVATQVRFDDASSTHSTLLELITQDRPGLLYEVSSVLAELGCNIEVALIDTEGQKVIDVFYLTCGRRKLEAGKQQEVEKALRGRL